MYVFVCVCVSLLLDNIFLVTFLTEREFVYTH